MENTIIKRARSAPIKPESDELTRLLPTDITRATSDIRQVIIDEEADVPVMGLSEYSNIQEVYRKKIITVWQQINVTREEAEAAGIDTETLERLWAIEHLRWRRLRFANIAIMPEKFLRYLFTREVDMSILHRQLSYKPSPHLLTAGRSLPLRAECAISRVYAVNAFVYGFEFGVINGIKFSLLTLLFYQIANAGNIRDFVTDLLYGKQKSIYAILTKFDSSHGRYLGLLFALPFVLAIARALYASTQAKPLTDQYWQVAEDFFTKFSTQTSLWHRSLYWMIPLVPGKRRLTMFTDALCWDGRLTNTERQQAFEWINGVAQGNGYAQFVAMQRLARLVHGVSLTQAKLIKKYYDPEIEQQLWKLKTDALIALTQKALSPQEAWKQRKLFSTLYAHYLKWTLADSNTRSMSAFMSMFKLTKSTASLWIVKTFLQALINYLHCPEEYQTGFTLAGGLADWASKNTQACFEEYVALFNSIPGQPIQTLTSLIPSFDLRNMSSLDLSNKGLNGTQVAQILVSLKQQEVPLTRLNVSGNVINEPIGLAALFPELTAITDLDFSNNGLVIVNPNSEFPEGSAEGLMAFSQGLFQLTRLQALRLAQNYIGDLDGDDGSGVNSTIHFGQALSVLVNLRLLDLSQNYIGSWDNDTSTGTQAIGQGIAQLQQLQSLNLSVNFIGHGDRYNSKGTQAIGQGTAQLSQLQSLDLSRNNIGIQDQFNSTGTQAIGQGIAQLSQLQSLNLSVNRIGWIDQYNSNGTQAIGQGIAQLTQLQSLDLSGNVIGSRDQYNSNGTQAIGQGIAQLRQLQSLDLWYNYIGHGDQFDSTGTQTIGLGIAQLLRLQFLDLSVNQIGTGDYYNSTGTQAIGEGLRFLSNLQTLALGNNEIGSAVNSTGTLAIAESLPFLHQLKNITIMPLASLNNATVLLNAVRQLPVRIYSDLPILLYPNEVAPYFKSMCNTNTTLNLGGKLNGLPTAMWVAIGNALAHCTQLTSLDLSDNNFAGFDDLNSTGAQAIGEGIAQLTLLQSLDLSGNSIGYGDSYNSTGTQAIGEGIAQLALLQSLDLSGNSIGTGDYYNSTGTQAIGQGIAQLRQLQSLGLSGNSIGYWDCDNSNGTQAIGQGIAQLTQLQSLDLSGNSIGYWDGDTSNGTQAIGEGISQLRQLQSLDLSVNGIGSSDQYNSNGTKAIIHSLLFLNQLSALDFSGTYLGYNDSLSVQLLGQSLSSLNQLHRLNLAGSPGYIGSTDDLGVIAIANGIRYLTNLCEINLGNNQIGSAGPNGSFALLEVIPTLPNLKIIGLAGIQNVTWTQAAQALATINEDQLQGACYAQRCFADSGLIPQGTCDATTSEAMTSEQTLQPFFARHLASPETVAARSMAPDASWTCAEPSQSQWHCVNADNATLTVTKFAGHDWSEVPTDHALHCDTHTEQDMQVTHCVGEKSEYVELHPQSNASLLSTLGSAILIGAVYTALPEALGDALSLSGLVSHENAEHVKTAANVALTVTMGSYWATAASYAMQATLQRLGVSAEKSRVAANSAAFVINTVRDFTPLGIAVTGANYVAGRFTLWAEKKAARSIAERLQPASPVSASAALKH